MRHAYSLLLVSLAACSAPSSSESAPASPPPASTDQSAATPDAQRPSSEPKIPSPAPIVPCDSPRGLLHAQTLTVEGGARTYLLYVPSSYTCAKAAPLLVDYHAYWGGTAPEEAYLLDDAVAVAEKEGFLLLRPRGLPRVSGTGAGAWTWDDVPKHDRFTDALLADVARRYAIDPTRRYALGFSNGTYMAMSALQRGDARFAGVAVVGGAFRPTAAKLAASSQRVYVSSGYRDLNRAPSVPQLLAEVPAARVLVRETPAGHVLRPFHYREAWAFLDRNERPAAGAAVPAWTAARGPALGTSILGQSNGDPSLAYGTAGAVVRVSEGAVTVLHEPSEPWDAASVCALDDGTLIAADGMQLHRAVATSPSAPGPAFETVGALTLRGSYPSVVTCAGASFTLFGSPLVRESDDVGKTFPRSYSLESLGGEAMALGATRTPRGTDVLVGPYGFLAYVRSGEPQWSDAPLLGTDHGVAFDLNAVTAAGTHVWAVGGGGSVLRSDDDGATFVSVAVPAEAAREDLYVASFFDERVGLVGGSHGSVFVTTDGGAHWEARFTGGDDYVGAAYWSSATHVTVLGGHGAAFSTRL